MTATSTMNETKVQIKIEPDVVVKVKQEDIAPYSLDDKSNCVPNIYPKIKEEPETKLFYQENDVKIKTEDDSSDELSDHFIESCTKFEKSAEFDSNNSGNSIDDAFFNQDRMEAYIKEDKIEVEEHQIKLETSESIESDVEDTNHDNPDTTKAKILQCNHCSYQTPTPSSFKKHVALHQDPSLALLYFCTKCSYRTRQKSHLKRHDLIHQSDVVKFKCAICDFKTKQKCTLKRHIDSVHANRHSSSSNSTKSNVCVKGEVFACNECSYTTYKKGLLISHRDKHKDTSNVTNLFICDVCSFSTKYRRNLRVHLETHKESPVLQIYECKLCSFRTRLGYCLKRHLLSRKHLLAAGKIDEYCPRTLKL